MNISYPNNPTPAEREQMLQVIRGEFLWAELMLAEALEFEGDTPARVAMIEAEREQQRHRFQEIYEIWGGVGPITPGLSPS